MHPSNLALILNPQQEHDLSQAGQTIGTYTRQTHHKAELNYGDIFM